MLKARPLPRPLLCAPLQAAEPILTTQLMALLQNPALCRQLLRKNRKPRILGPRGFEKCQSRLLQGQRLSQAMFDAYRLTLFDQFWGFGKRGIDVNVPENSKRYCTDQTKQLFLLYKKNCQQGSQTLARTLLDTFNRDVLDTKNFRACPLIRAQDIPPEGVQRFLARFRDAMIMKLGYTKEPPTDPIKLWRALANMNGLRVEAVRVRQKRAGKDSPRGFKKVRYHRYSPSWLRFCETECRYQQEGK